MQIQIKYESSKPKVSIQYLYFLQKVIILTACFKQEQPIDPRNSNHRGINYETYIWEMKSNHQYMVVITGPEYALISENLIRRNV